MLGLKAEEHITKRLDMLELKAEEHITQRLDMLEAKSRRAHNPETRYAGG